MSLENSDLSKVMEELMHLMFETEEYMAMKKTLIVNIHLQLDLLFIFKTFYPEYIKCTSYNVVLFIYLFV